MPTLDDLIGIERLISIEVPLDDDTQTWRRLLAIPAFIEWLDEVLPSMQTTIVGGEITPLEQVDAVFAEYISGEVMRFDRRFKKLNPLNRHAWEFKTPDIRIFGWIPQKDHFICTFGDHKDQLEIMNSYGKFIARTVYERENLQLDDPNCVTEETYEAVLSNQD